MQTLSSLRTGPKGIPPSESGFRAPGISHATPFSIQLLTETLRDPKIPDRAAVIAILEKIGKATLFQIEGPLYLPLNATLQDLISPKYLWPKFISEEEDEVLWAELDNYEEWKSFQAVSAQVFINERAFFLKLVAENHESAAAARRLLHIVEAIEKSYKVRVETKNKPQTCPDIAWPEFANQTARYDWYRLVIAAYASLWEGHVSQMRVEPVSEADIAKLEAQIGCSLPQPLRNYHLEFGALKLAETLCNVIRSDYQIQPHLKAFPGIIELTYDDTVLDLAEKLVVFGDYLGNGNMFCFHHRTGEVYYFDHDRGELLTRFFSSVQDYLDALMILCLGEIHDDEEAAEALLVERYGQALVRKWRY
jgi:SMI1-KNR4 cell-wall